MEIVQLTKEELCAVIMHITKKRGTTVNSLADESKDDESTKAILSKNQLELKQGKFICEIQLERLQNEGKVRGISNNFKTIDYVHELEQILSQQNLDSEIINNIVDIIKRRRNYDQGPGSEKSPTPYGSYRIVDGQLIRVNLIDEMRGKCSVFPEELRAPKQSYTAELFNMLNDLNNLSIKGEKISVDEKHKIIDYINMKGNISIKQLLKILEVEESEVTGFRIDKNENALITEFKGYSKVLKVFKSYHLEHLLEDKSIVDNIIDIEIAFLRLRRSDAVCFIGNLRMKRLFVRFRIHRNTDNAKIAAGANDAHGNFASIGNQYLCKHTQSPMAQVKIPCAAFSSPTIATPSATIILPRSLITLTCSVSVSPGRTILRNLILSQDAK